VEPRDAGRGPSVGHRLRKAVVFAVLAALLILVQLPLLWMVLTAFKTKGTAFQLRFLPDTSLYTPDRQSPPLQIPEIDESKAYLHAELKREGATTVELVVEADGRSSDSFPMRYFGGGSWSATVGPFAESEVRFHFLVDGSAIVQPEGPGSKASPLILQPGVNGGGESAGVLVYRSRDKIVARIRGEAGHSFALLLGERTIEPLQRAKAGEGPGKSVFGGTFPSRGESTFRLIERRGFGEALRELYTLDNFRLILASEDFNFGRYFLNSFVVAGSSGLLTVALCLLGAFAFGYFTFHFRDTLFFLLLASMLVPGTIYMVPQFSITLNLGLMNTYAGMVVPHLANVFGLFLLRQYVLQIPRDLFAAAEIDGAGDLQMFRTIVIPVCLPIVVTLFLVVFVTQWSNFLWQLIINTGDSQVLTLPVGLQQFKGQNASDWERIMAGACFSILPITILFLVLQRYFLQGMIAGTVKE